MVQGSISLKLVLFFFFTTWLECHRLPIFKLFLEEVGSDRVPKVFFFFFTVPIWGSKTKSFRAQL